MECSGRELDNHPLRIYLYRSQTSTNSDGWEGFSVDHLNPDAFELFSNTVIKPLIKTAQSAGNSVKFLQTDSWEMGIVSWTNNFPE